jgi:hypothetical protein
MGCYILRLETVSRIKHLILRSSAGAKQDRAISFLISPPFGPRAATERLAHTGKESELLKNSSVQYQHLIIFQKINITIPIPHPASSRILHALLSWDRMITGIRESRRPMAVLDRGIQGGRSPSAMSPPAFARFERSAPCAGQEAKSRDRACGEPTPSRG